MKNKKKVSLALAAALVSLTLLPAAAATPFTAQEAQKVAEKYVPAGSTFLHTEDDGGRYEVKFYSEDRQERYEVKVSKSSKALAAFESKLGDHRGGTAVTLTEAQAGQAVSGEIKNAEILSTTLERDDGYSEYQVRFQTDTLYGEYTVHPQSGKVLEREVRVGAKPAQTGAAGFIGADKAAELAKAQVPGGLVTDLDLDREDGAYFYEVEIIKDGVEHELGLNATTGGVIWHNQDSRDYGASSNQPAVGRERQGSRIEEPATGGNAQPAGNGAYIGLEKAKEIALAKVPGATVRKCKLDVDDGRAQYEGELYKDGWEYEFEIDAVTGSILDWDQDYDD